MVIFVLLFPYWRVNYRQQCSDNQVTSQEKSLLLEDDRLACRAERVTRADLSVRQTTLEPLGTLCRTAVSKPFWHHASCCHLLKAIVPDRSRSVQPRLYVSGLEDISLCCGMSPHACVAVGLQFHRDGETVLKVAPLLLYLSDLTLCAEKILHMVANLMRDYIGLRELPGAPNLSFNSP